MPLNLTHLRPCGERWEEMTPTERGRRCARCEKEIVDFRGRTDLEIGLVHAASESPVCGLYSPAHLRGATGGDARPRMRQLVSIVTGLSIAASGSSAAQVPSPAIEQAPAPEGSTPARERDASEAARPIAAPAAEDTLVLQGAVRDSATGQPLHGAMVMLKDSQIGTLTSPQGEYVLRLPRRRAVSASPVLVVMLIGYARVEIPIPTGESHVRRDVLLSQQQVDPAGFYVTAVPVNPSFGQRIRRLFRGAW